jgi:hypothetical protein
MRCIRSLIAHAIIVMRNWSVAGSIDGLSTAILAIHTDCFKLLILAISCKNLGDEYLDTTGSGLGPTARERIVLPRLSLEVASSRDPLNRDDGSSDCTGAALCASGSQLLAPRPR